MEALTPDTTAWVEPPFGLHSWTPPTLDGGLTLTTIVRPWRWKERAHPQPALRAVFPDKLYETSTPRLTLGNLYIVDDPTQYYAYVVTNGHAVPCQAQAHGGNFDVECTTTEAGQLVVQENSWTG